RVGEGRETWVNWYPRTNLNIVGLLVDPSDDHFSLFLLLLFTFTCSCRLRLCFRRLNQKRRHFAIKVLIKVVEHSDEAKEKSNQIEHSHTATAISVDSALINLLMFQVPL